MPNPSVVSLARFLAVLLVVSLFPCNTEAQEASDINASALPPILWDGNDMEFTQQELATEMASMDSIVTPDGLYLSGPDSTGRMKLTGAMEPLIGTIDFWKGTERTSRIIRNTAKIPSGCALLKTIEATPGQLVITPPPRGMKLLAIWQNTPIDGDSIRPSSRYFRVYLPPEVLESSGLSHMRILAYNDSCVTNELLVPFLDGVPVSSASQLPQDDFRKTVAYSLNIDRFYNGDRSNDSQLDVRYKMNYQNGDLAGLKAKINEGFFDSLGVNTLVISPLLDQPDEPVGDFQFGSVNTAGAGWHGQWPVSNINLENRWGSKEDLDSLFQVLQSKNMKAYMEYPAREIYQEHHLLTDSLIGYADSLQWVTDSLLPDSSVNVGRWNEKPYSTWSAPYMRALNLSDSSVTRAMSDSMLTWTGEYGFEGLFIRGANKVEPLYWQYLVQKKVDNRDRMPFMVSYSDENEGQYDGFISKRWFEGRVNSELYEEVTATFMKDSLSVSGLHQTISGDIHSRGNVTGFNISGGYSYPRFLSLASGDLKVDEDQVLAGWERELEDHSQELPYRKLGMLHALNFALPGVPLIYYGDEYGMPGAKAPDNSRRLKIAGYSVNEKNVRKKIQELAETRKSSMPLLYGSTEVKAEDRSTLLIRRDYMKETILIVFNVSRYRRLIENPWTDLEMNRATVLFDHSLEVSRDYSAVVLPPFSFEYIIISKEGKQEASN